MLPEELLVLPSAVTGGVTFFFTSSTKLKKNFSSGCSDFFVSRNFSSTLATEFHIFIQKMLLKLLLMAY
jgi:hypothetical protein